MSPAAVAIPREVQPATWQAISIASLSERASSAETTTTV